MSNWQALMTSFYSFTSIFIENLYQTTKANSQFMWQWVNLIVCHPRASFLNIWYFLDCQLCPEDFALDNTSSKFKPTLIIIPLRLGIGEINPVYINSLKKCLELETSCGIIGGRPNEALYFFGYAGEELLFHDPHQVQMSGRVGNKETEAEIEQDSTYHKSSPGRMQFTSMDPSSNDHD